MSAEDARGNARRAIEEEDRERLLADRRFAAATFLATTTHVQEALVAGQEVPRGRLHADVLRAAGETTVGPPLVLDDDLALRVEVRVREQAEHEDGAFVRRASDVHRERVVWEWPDRIARGHVTALVGPPGVGKSLLTCWLAARRSRGELGDACDVVMATAEDSLAATVRPRLEAAEADLDRVHFLRMRRDGVEGDVSLPDDVEELRRLVAELGPCLVVIDPLPAHLAGQVDSHRDQSVRRALAPLHHLADEFGCAVVVLLHTNKAPGNDPLLRTGGSIGLTALVRSALLLARDPQDPAGETGNSRVLANFKNNLGPEAPSLRFEVVPTLLPASGSEPDVTTARLAERGVCDLTGSDLLRGPEPVSAHDRAKAFVAVSLTDTWVLAGDVYEAGEAEGHSHRSLERAAKELRDEEVLAAETRPGKPPTTWWRLAVPPSPRDEAGGTGVGGTEEDGETLPSRPQPGGTESLASEAVESTTGSLVPPTVGDMGGTEDTASVPPTASVLGGLGGTWECPSCTRIWSPPPSGQCKCGHSPRLAALSAEGRKEDS